MGDVFWDGVAGSDACHVLGFAGFAEGVVA
jgi:hypothetical protein